MPVEEEHIDAEAADVDIEEEWSIGGIIEEECWRSMHSTHLPHFLFMPSHPLLCQGVLEVEIGRGNPGVMRLPPIPLPTKPRDPPQG